MDLQQLLHGIGQSLNGEVTNITSDSRQVRPGTVFVAVQGVTQDGHNFVEAAAKAGAVAILGERPRASYGSLAAPYFEVKDSAMMLARLASRFYGYPTHGMLVVGVTGTSGKTTTTYLIESILQAAGHDVGVIGTVNFRQGGRILPSTHTTPGAVELQGLLADMKAQGATAIVMEVSSHALKQNRVAEVAFDVGVFSNLSREHLDFHGDMQDYFESKAILFRAGQNWAKAAGKSFKSVVNNEDEYGCKLLLELGTGPQILPYEVGSGVQIDMSGIRGQMGGVAIDSPLVGAFNASNLAAAVFAGLALGIAPEAITRGIQQLAEVPGRLQRVPNPLGIHVVVDYAHKPDALEKVLQTLSAVKGPHRLITVFGCGGDRDRTKRPVMGKLAVDLSDYVLITSDNPRTEDPESIIREILVGVGKASHFKVESDRKLAIELAIDAARPGDLVLIAGKGHEDYQIIAAPGGGTQKIHFDDREVAQDATKRRGPPFGG